MEDPSLGTFQTIYGNCPAILKEPFFINQAGSPAQLVAQLLNLYWFANLAPRLLVNDPPTRMVFFGCWVDVVNSSGVVTGQDYHSALAMFMLIAGPNCFFDAITTVGGQQPILPSIWLPTYNHLGAPVSGPVLISGSGATSFYKRSYTHGTVYFNFSGATVTAVPPAGSTNWTGSPVTLVTLTSAKGEVVWGL
jgi:hypothetical protein